MQILTIKKIEDPEGSPATAPFDKTYLHTHQLTLSTNQL